jgi:NAD(P)H dehydrogenase (quinone)
VNALVVHAHPEPRSFCAALKATAAEELAALGCEVTISDLYAERFRPDLSADDFTSRERGDFLRPMEEQQHGVTTGTLAPDVAREVDRLRAADLVVFTAPMWWFSVPAMLKGWFDRVLVNGYAYGTVKAWTGPLIDKRAVLAMTCSYEQAGFRAGGSSGELEPLLRARAIENQCFVLAAGQHGFPGGGRKPSYGHSMIIDPWGVVLAEAPDGDGVIVAELDLDAQRDIRERLPALRHRALRGRA